MLYVFRSPTSNKAISSAVLIISDFFVQSFMLCLLKRPFFNNSEELTICPGERNTDAKNVCIGCREGG